MKKFFAAFVSLILCGTMLAFAACAANPTPSADNEQIVGDEESGDRPEVPVVIPISSLCISRRRATRNGSQM